MKLLLAGIALALLVYLLPPGYRHTYYYSADKKQCVTRIEYLPYDWVPNNTFLIYNRFDGNDLPDQYVNVKKDKTMGGNWNGYLHFEKGQANFVATRGTVSNDYAELFAAFDMDKARRLGFSSDSLLAELKNDRSGNTYYLEGTIP